MDIKQILDFARGVRPGVTSIRERITALEAERERIEQATPHVDDLIAWAVAGLDEADRVFEQTLGAIWNDFSLAQVPGGWFSSGPSGRGYTDPRYPQLLMLPRGAVPNQHPLPPSNLGPQQTPLNAACLVHFLRPAIEKEIPELVRRHFPAAAGGMRYADRKRKLDGIDADLTNLRRQLQEIEAAIAETKRQLA